MNQSIANMMLTTIMAKAAQPRLTLDSMAYPFDSPALGVPSLDHITARASSHGASPAYEKAHQHGVIKAPRHSTAGPRPAPAPRTFCRNVLFHCMAQSHTRSVSGGGMIWLIAPAPRP